MYITVQKVLSNVTSTINPGEHYTELICRGRIARERGRETHPQRWTAERHTTLYVRETWVDKGAATDDKEVLAAGSFFGLSCIVQKGNKYSIYDFQIIDRSRLCCSVCSIIGVYRQCCTYTRIR